MVLLDFQMTVSKQVEIYILHPIQRHAPSRTVARVGGVFPNDSCGRGGGYWTTAVCCDKFNEKSESRARLHSCSAVSFHHSVRPGALSFECSKKTHVAKFNRRQGISEENARMEYKEGSFLTYVPSGEMAVEFSSDSSCSLSRHVFRVEVARKEPQQLQQERERSAFLRMQKDGQTNLHPEYRHIVRDTRTEETLLQHNITVDSVLASILDNEGTRGDGVDVKDNSGRIVGRRFISQRITCYPMQEGNRIPFPAAFMKQLQFLLSCDEQLPTVLKEPMHMAASYINCAENDPEWSGLVYSCCHFMWLWNAGSPFNVHSGRICMELPFGSNGKYILWFEKNQLLAAAILTMSVANQSSNCCLPRTLWSGRNEN